MKGKWRKNIPIFDLVLYLIVDEDMPSAYARLPKTFTIPPDSIDSAITCSDGTGKFAILFKEECSDGFVSHEVRHAVDFMMQYLGAKPRWEGETMALLSHYISDWVYSKLM